MNSFKQSVENKSNDELLKMVYEFDQWNVEMLKAIEDELSKRQILPDDIIERRKSAIEMDETNLLAGKDASLIGLFIGWLLAFGTLGIFIGHHYCYSKTYSKFTNKKYFTYNESSRKKAAYLFYTSIFLTIVAIFYKISTLYN